MTECIFHNVHFQSCCGCNSECRKIEESKTSGYTGFAVDDNHRRCPGLHERIHKILLKRLNLMPFDIVRLGIAYVSYQGFGVEEWEDFSKNWLQVMVEIKENSFIMGSLDRECEGEIKLPDYFLGSFWIGRTRYDISREKLGCV